MSVDMHDSSLNCVSYLLVGFFEVQIRVVLDLVHIFRMQHDRCALGKHELEYCPALKTRQSALSNRLGSHASYLGESLGDQVFRGSIEELFGLLVRKFPSSPSHQGNAFVWDAIGKLVIKTRHKQQDQGYSSSLEEALRTQNFLDDSHCSLCASGIEQAPDHVNTTEWSSKPQARGSGAPLIYWLRRLPWYIYLTATLVHYMTGIVYG